MYYQEIPLRPDGSAQLDCYVQDPQISTGICKTRPALIVCPGGAYLKLARKEGEPVAMRFAGLGYQTFVCRYLTFMDPASLEEGQEPKFRLQSHFPEQLVDLMRSIALVREKAQEWGIDPQRVYVMGFSAGAHLCGLLAECWDDPAILERAGLTAEDAARVRPDAAVLGYPMLNSDPKLENHDILPPEDVLAMAFFGTTEPTQEMFERFDLVRNVRADMPRIFAWHTTQDNVVDPRDTVALIARLLELGVPCELHLFEQGPHGTALCDETSAVRPRDINPVVASWVSAADAWLRLDAK